MATEMAVGLAIAQQMMQQPGAAIFPGAGGAAASPASAGFPELLSPAQVGQALGVSETDVVSLIDSGELKAKKIGSTYRIKRSSVDAFLSD